ncbi:hypothetical protein CAPTEDRAFT_224970 [Capitella teleta]|uniref:Nuclear receptor-binding factor 2 MIT domain-containing protein n=1 Tax=Capitella teleta TaxID=283909 RepID=R7UKE3_CAPTE|nr:hypothetical protein CAPTEDRAFT_224970 [Capitella teleta]|eukprot:ELU07009.1 hypothetical protein CAPTEDRAFT_224970 [Capitella teleta]
MDVSQSPLNLAHQEGRKAERLLAATKYDRAIECHQKAADLLSEALKSTSIPQMRESLSLQRKQHLQQKKVIRYKQQVAALHDAALDDDETPADGAQQQTLNLLESDEGDIRRCDDSMMTSVHRTIEECDSLLQFLNDRATAAGRTYHQPDTLKILLTHNNYDVHGTKIPKDDQLIIEELRLHNVALRSHITDLLTESDENRIQMKNYEQELNQYRQENYELKEKVLKYQRAAQRNRHRITDEYEMEKSVEGQNYPFPSCMNLDDLPGLKLPPLEMPEFDFDSLKIASSDQIDETDSDPS